MPEQGIENRSRERVALVMFVVLVLLGGIILIGYFSTGKDWSVAATLLDDSVGSLDDYAVIAFEGTTEPVAVSSDVVSAPDERSTMRAPYASVEGGGTGEHPTEGISQIIRSVYQRFEKQQEAAHGEGVYVSDVRDLYELKGASVITLKVGDPAYYADPVIIDSGNRSFGVFSLSSYASRVQMKGVVDSLKASGADTVVCIAPRSAMVSTCDGVDVLILTDESPEGFEAMRAKKSDEGTLAVLSPKRGTAGVIIFSSNNVPFFKPIEAL